MASRRSKPFCWKQSSAKWSLHMVSMPSGGCTLEIAASHWVRMSLPNGILISSPEFVRNIHTLLNGVFSLQMENTVVYILHVNAFVGIGNALIIDAPIDVTAFGVYLHFSGVKLTVPQKSRAIWIAENKDQANTSGKYYGNIRSLSTNFICCLFKLTNVISINWQHFDSFVCCHCEWRHTIQFRIPLH